MRSQQQLPARSQATTPKQNQAPAARRSSALGSETETAQADMSLSGLRFENISMLPPVSAPIIQTKSAIIGPPGDVYEQEADRVADEVTGSAPKSGQRLPQLRRGPAGVLRRRSSAGGATASVGNKTELGSTLGGSSLPSRLRQEFEPKFGADFGGVRIHTDAQAVAWNRSLRARAFTTDQDIFFGEGEYRPDTKEGQKVLAHELTHVCQQNPDLLSAPLLHDTTHAIRPLRINPKDQKYYSDASAGLVAAYRAEDAEDAFLTATSNNGTGGGHTTIYIEYFKDMSGVDVPQNLRVELFLGTGGGISISLKQYDSQKVQGNLFNVASPFKKSWKKKRADAEAAVKTAEDIQADQRKYTYYKLGRGPTLGNKVLNCARFGQRVLQAAGIAIHIGSAKLPKRITDPTKLNGALAPVAKGINLPATATSGLPDYCRSKTEFLKAVKRDVHESGSSSLLQAAGCLHEYHQQPEVMLRYSSLIGAIKQITDYVKAAAVNEFVEKTNNPSATPQPSESLQFIRDDFYDKLKTEAARLRSEVISDMDLLRDNNLPDHGYADIGPKIKDAMDKLEEYMSYSSSDALVKARVRAYLSSGGVLNQKKYDQVIASGQQGAIVGHWG